MRRMSALPVSLVVSCLSIGLSASLAWAEDPLRFDLPAQPLVDSLRAVASQTQINVFFDPKMIAGRRAPAVSNTDGVKATLQKLLEGSGLTFRFSDERTVTVMREEPTAGAGLKKEAIRLAATNAEATNEAAGNVPGEDSSPKLEEIVVTAQKREERLIDTPQSVSVLSADSIAKLGATQFRDFATTIPGLSFSTSGAGANQITIRGLSTGYDIGSTVGIYVDDIPFGTSGAFAQGAQNSLEPGLFDIDRVEVLRGPQGTLYGASTMGGLIKYVSRQPDLRTLRGGVRAGLSQTTEGGVSYNVAGDVNIPLATDMAALHASGFQSHDGGYIDNVTLDQGDVNQSNIYGGRLDLLLEPNDRITVRLNAFLQNIDRDGEATANYAYTSDSLSGALDQERLVEEPWRQRFRLMAATVAYDLGRATATSITSYQSVNNDYSFDVSPVFVPIFASVGRQLSAVGYNVGTGTDKVTQELRLASNGGRTLDWLFGGYYTREKTSNEQNLGGFDLTGAAAPNDLFVFSVPSKYEEYAVFGDLTWHWTPALDVSAGVRHAYDRQSKVQTGSGLFGSDQSPTKVHEDVVTYLANARYHFTDRRVGYLRFATGYRPGGPNFVSLDPLTQEPNGPASFEADELKSYEAGFKAESEDRRFGMDLAAYHIDWSNIQVSVSSGNGFTGIGNAPGGATVNGAELTLSARPTERFVAVSAFAYQDASLDQEDRNLGARKGERLPNVPEFTAAISADYFLALTALQPALGMTVRYNGERFASFDGSTGFPQYKLPEYTTVDLRLGMTFALAEARHVDLQLYVHNLFDERGQLGNLYPQFGTPTAGARIAVSQPRTLGLSASTRF